MKIKTNFKILLLVSLLLITMCIFSTNVVNATEATQNKTNTTSEEATKKETTSTNETQQTLNSKESKKNLDIVPNTIKIDITEFQGLQKNEKYQLNAQNSISKQIENVLKNGGIDMTNLELVVNPLFGDTADIKVEDIHNFEVNLYQKDNTEQPISTKKITVEYSNSSTYNAKDEQYVKEKSKVIHEYVWATRDIMQDEPWGSAEFQVEDFVNTVNTLINDQSIKVIFQPNGMGGSNWSDGVDGLTFFFKNNVLYRVQQIGFTRTYMVTIPEDVRDTEKAYIDYAIPKIHQWLEKEWNTTIDISKITIAKEKNSNFYNVTVDGSTDSMLIQKANTVKVIDGIGISNILPNGVNVNANPIDKNNATYITMLEKAKEKGFSNVFTAYDLKLSSGTLKDKLTITFDIGTQYNDKQVIILHQKQDSTIEEFTETVKNGRVSVTVTELSPFMVAVKEIIPENTNNTDNTNNKDNTDNRELDNEPKTGIENYVLLASTITLLSIGGIVTLKLKKQ